MRTLYGVVFGWTFDALVSESDSEYPDITDMRLTKTYEQAKKLAEEEMQDSGFDAATIVTIREAGEYNTSKTFVYTESKEEETTTHA